MANHPEDRLAFRKSAFKNVGMDLFGPIIVTDGRRKLKRWGVLFTCLATRAIHLELVHSLSGESLVMAIENMVNRRGPVMVIRSDNGTNLVWAATNIKCKFGRSVTWKFIPPAAPHQGGAWERLVGSVKQALSQMEIPEIVSDEQLKNFLIKAEALVNARPLTEVPTHPDKPVLTPNHFLYGSSNGGSDDDFFEEENDTETVYARLLQERGEHKEMLNVFWDRWAKEYLPVIAARKKWSRKTEPLHEGDLVYICEPTGWIRGIVSDTLIDPETNQVREVMVRTDKQTYRRPATKVAKIRTSPINIGDGKTNKTQPTSAAEAKEEPETTFKGPMTRARATMN